MSEFDALKKQEEGIQDFNDIELEFINSDYLSSKRGKFIKLLDGPSEAIKFDKKDKRSFDFEDAVYVKTISFISDKSTPPDITVEVVYATGQIRTNFRLNKSPHQDNRNFISVQGFVKSFSIKSDRMMRDEKVKRVMVHGLNGENFHQMVNKAAEFMDSYKDIKSECKRIIDSAESNLKEIQTKKSDIDTQLKDLDNQNVELIKKVAGSEINLAKSEYELENSKKMKIALEAEIDIHASKEILLRNSIQELTRTNSTLNESISDMKGKLETLSLRKDLYAETMSDFVSESGSQLKIYYVFIFITIIGLAWMGINSVDKINELVKEYQEILKLNPNANSWNLIALRIPYASIVLAVFGGLTALINTLANKVFEIHSQKRHIIGLSVLARDINSASKHGTNLSEEQIYQFREQLKFELLSDSLVGQSFKPLLEKRLASRVRVELNEKTSDNKEEMTTTIV